MQGKGHNEMKITVVFDCEVYSNYFLLAIRNVENGKSKHWELYEGVEWPVEEVVSALCKYRLVSFNGLRFDMPLISMANAGCSTQGIKAACDAIIQEGMKHWDKDFLYRFPEARYSRDSYDHIDLIEVAPGTASLKIYGGRLHSKRMQDLPIEPGATITPEQRDLLRSYCLNDLQTTVDLFNHLKPQIELREHMGEQYGMDLRSKSDAQIAEAVIRSQVEELLERKVRPPEILPFASFVYDVPGFISFSTPALRDALKIVTESRFVIGKGGAVEMPEKLGKSNIVIGRGCYRMGIGGLHSTEECSAHVADGARLIDRDVTSYYPSIILKEQLAPAQMGPIFLRVYRDILNRRVKAKRAGDKVTDATLKIVLNGSFGKFGSMYSALYSPKLLIQTTITGQLALLMLIEMLEQAGIPVVSANTDGVVIKCPAGRDDDMERIVWVWEQATGFETDATEYRAIYSRDVNNYVAVKLDGKTKLKGVFAPTGLAKNPANEVCVRAALAQIVDGIPVEQSIAQAGDIREFVTIRRVAGGAVKAGQYLGKAVRWYYAVDCPGPITYVTNGNKVARSDGAKPLMDLPGSMPDDVDRQWYINEAKAILKSIGHTNA